MATVKQRRSLGNVTVSSDEWKAIQELMQLMGVTQPLKVVSESVRFRLKALREELKRPS